MKMDENTDNLIYGNIFISCTHMMYIIRRHTLKGAANNPTTLMNCTFSVCHTHVSWYTVCHTYTYIEKHKQSLSSEHTHFTLNTIRVNPSKWRHHELKTKINIDFNEKVEAAVLHLTPPFSLTDMSTSVCVNEPSASRHTKKHGIFVPFQTLHIRAGRLFV